MEESNTGQWRSESVKNWGKIALIKTNSLRYLKVLNVQRKEKNFGIRLSSCKIKLTEARENGTELSFSTV